MTKDDERESFGEAMAACTPREREFVLHVMQNKPFAEAARLSGCGTPDSTAETFARIGYRYSHRPRVIEAMKEEAAKQMRTTLPAALKAVKDIIQNPFSKDRARTALAVIERADPTIQKQEIQVTHTINHEAEAIDQLRTLKALNVARDKLIEVFGCFGLERLEKKLAIENKSDVIDADFAEVPRDPDAELLGE
jgi:hypothetical protein